ncbi:MAG: adenylosuccinate lyase [Planctomycetota bacterium]|nr:adenylosuccinate lyase [Planctomycetota bacterium]
MDALYERYADREMLEFFSEERRYRLWRELWLALAEEQHALGISVISEEALKEMRKALNKRVNLEKAAEYEKKTRHDIMAHIHLFGDDAPAARGIIHLGATSYDIVDNADLLNIRDALNLLISRIAFFTGKLRDFALSYSDFVTAAYTHLQVAQPTTVGRRAAYWLSDFCRDIENLSRFRSELRFRSIKGAVGTQSSFDFLFKNDSSKVKELETRIAKRFGFDKTYSVASQIYSRKVDSELLDLLASFGVSAHKFATDVRLLCAFGDFLILSGEEQVGSSAMPHKTNPVWAERVCALSRYLFSLSEYARQTAAHNWLERSLDDSAARRIYIPRAFLAASAIVKLCYGTLTSLRPAKSRTLEENLPLLVMEPLLILATMEGADRQKTHSFLKKAASVFRETNSIESLKSFLRENPALKEIDLDDLLKPERLVGRAKEQVEEFIKGEVDPLLSRFKPSKIEQPEV